MGENSGTSITFEICTTDLEKKIGRQSFKIYGSTPEEAQKNAIEFYETFIGDKWRSMSGLCAGRQWESGKEYYYTFTCVKLDVTLPKE